MAAFGDLSLTRKDSRFFSLVYREQPDADLLIIRVTTEGTILPAKVLFASSKCESQESARIVSAERVRMSRDITVDFKYDDGKNSILDKCLELPIKHGDSAEIQFCAILPLTEEQCTKNRRVHHPLRPIEKLLKLYDLVDNAVSAYGLWCTCQEEEDERSMILCDSTQCPVGWYHKSCVDLDEDYTALQWFCQDCHKEGNTSYSSYDNEDFEDSIFEASDQRVQRVRSLDHAFKSHIWPDPKDVRHMMFREVFPKIKLSFGHQRTPECLRKEDSATATQCWAISRNDLSRILPIR
jgi:hypothetical protein